MIRVSCEAEYLPKHCDHSYSDTSLFRESFALGLSLTVSEISALVTLVLYFMCAFNDYGQLPECLTTFNGLLQ